MMFLDEQEDDNMLINYFLRRFGNDEHIPATESSSFRCSRVDGNVQIFLRTPTISFVRQRRFRDVRYKHHVLAAHKPEKICFHVRPAKKVVV
eukprot:754178-Hanusia_phi.AAC.7